jgi:endogenous inhibitor of DNA gyrase (YacG/DUF329 family)
MPIRHCQKCSLKVLIDESQSNVSPFYCQRCTAALKSESAASPTPAKGNRRSSPQLTPVPATAAVAVAAPPAASGKTSTIKVFCPYCKASFNGKIPAKPARGSCPLCQKDLILLPTGDIRPAADFDLAKWQAEQAGGGGEDEGGTQVLLKKYAASPAAAGAAESGKRIIEEKIDAPEPPPPPAPPEETQVANDGVELPNWLDETDRRKKPSAPVAAPSETDVADPVRLEDLDPVPPPPPPPPKRAAAPAPPPAKSSNKTTASVPSVGAAPAKKGLKREKTERRVAVPAVASPTDAIESGPSGSGKFLLSLLLTALPVAATPILLSTRDSLREGPLGTLGPRFVKGFKALDAKLFPVEVEAPPPPPPPKVKEPEPEAPAKPTAEDARRMEEEINKLWMEFKREERTVKQLSVGATAAQKADIQKAEAELKEKKARIDQRREVYRKAFGKDYDPTKQ